MGRRHAYEGRIRSQQGQHHPQVPSLIPRVHEPVGRRLFPIMHPQKQPRVREQLSHAPQSLCTPQYDDRVGSHFAIHLPQRDELDPAGNLSTIAIMLGHDDAVSLS